MPDGHSILSPVTTKRPSRQLLARIPLTLTIMQQRSFGETAPQSKEKIARQPPLMRTHRTDIPFFAVTIVNRHERWLATHRQAHVLHLQVMIYPVPQRIDGGPLFRGVRL